MRTFIAAVERGFGDAIICLPVINAIIDKCPNVYLVTRTYRQVGIAERIKGIAGEIAEADIKMEDDDVYINLREHPLQLNHVWGSPEFESFFGRTEIERIVATISKDFGFEADFKNLRKLEYEIRPEFNNCVAFVPGTDMFHKHWPNEHWRKLFSEIQRSEVEVILLGRPDESPAVKRLMDDGVRLVETPSIGDSIDVISNCRAVVAIDTGLMHVAVNQGVPTVALLHPTHFHMRSAKNCFNLTGAFCHPDCCRDFTPLEGFQSTRNLGVSVKFDHRECTLELSQNCMAKIKPQDVIDMLKQQRILN